MKLESWESVSMGLGGGLITSAAEKERSENEPLVGNLAFDLHGLVLEKGCWNRKVKHILLRAKPDGATLLSQNAECMKKRCPEEGEETQNAFAVWRRLDVRDVLIAKAAMLDSDVQSIMPKIHYVEIDKEKDISFFIMERFDDTIVSHNECIEGGASFTSDVWKKEDIQTVLSAISGFHAKFLDRRDMIQSIFGSSIFDGVVLIETASSYRKVAARYQQERYPDVWTSEVDELVEKINTNISTINEEFRRYPQTLIHDDFNTRNVCLRRYPEPGQSRLCTYDWEFTCIHAAQRDVSEFIMFALPENLDVEDVHMLCEFYRQCLFKKLHTYTREEEIISRATEPDTFKRIFDYNVMELLAFRLQLYLSIGFTYELPIPYTKRVISNCFTYLKSVKSQYQFLY